MKTIFGIAITLAAASAFASAPARADDVSACKDGDIAACNRVIDDPGTARNVLPFVYFDRGIAYSKAESYVDALSDLTKSIEMSPFWGTYLWRGHVHEELKQPNEAIADYGAAIELSPDKASPYLFRARVNMQLGEFAAAERDYDAVLRLKPDDQEAIDGRKIAAAAADRVNGSQGNAANTGPGKATPATSGAAQAGSERRQSPIEIVMAIEPQYDDARWFSEGQAPAMRDAKWGYIDKSGRWTIEPRFEDAGPFSDGMAAVKRDGNWGYVDKSGKLAIEPQFSLAEQFHEGLAIASKDGKNFGHINKSGSWVIEDAFRNFDTNRERWRKFHDGLVMVRRSLYGFADKTGRLVVDTKYSDAQPFSEGRAAVESLRQWGFVDTDGSEIVEPTFDSVLSFSEGLAAVELKSGKWGFIDKSGAWAIKAQFSSANGFAEGLAAVSDGKKWGFIDEAGKWVIEAQLDHAFFFTGGIAAAELEDKWGYIDKSGAWVIQPQFDFAFPVEAGIGRVMIGTLFDPDLKFGAINGSGALVAEPRFTDVQVDSQDMAVVELDGKWGFITKQGLIEPQYDSAWQFSDGLAPVKVEDKWGIIDASGAWVVEPQYADTKRFSEGYAAVEFGGKWGFVAKRASRPDKPTPQSAAAEAGGQQPQAGEADPAEIAFWETARDANDADMLRAYLEAYPQGHFSKLAEIMLKQGAD